jgi:hypothetical protein
MTFTTNDDRPTSTKPQLSESKKNLILVLRWDLTPRPTNWHSVGRNMTGFTLCFPLKMEAVISSKTLVTTYQMFLCSIPEANNQGSPFVFLLYAHLPPFWPCSLICGMASFINASQSFCLTPPGSSPAQQVAALLYYRAPWERFALSLFSNTLCERC